MLAFLGAFWTMVAGGVRTLFIGNAESRADFTAIVNTLQEDNKELRGELKRLDAKLDEVQDEVFTLRAENHQLKIKLAESDRRISESDRQHERDEATIASLTARVATLETKEMGS